MCGILEQYEFVVHHTTDEMLALPWNQEELPKVRMLLRRWRFLTCGVLIALFIFLCLVQFIPKLDPDCHVVQSGFRRCYECEECLFVHISIAALIAILLALLWVGCFVKLKDQFLSALFDERFPGLLQQDGTELHRSELRLYSCHTQVYLPVNR